MSASDSAIPSSALPKPPRRRGRGRWGKLFIAGLILGLGLYGLYHWLTDPQRLAGMVARRIQDQTGAQVQIDSAHFWLSGRLSLENVNLRVPSPAVAPTDPAGQLLHARRADLHFRWRDLITFQFEPRQVVLSHPRFYLTEVLPAGVYNFQQLTAAPSSVPSSNRPLLLPTLVIPQGQIIWGRSDARGYTQLHTLEVQANFLPDPATPHRHVLRIEPALGNTSSSSTTAPAWQPVVGHVDMHHRTLEVQCSSLALEESHRRLLPSTLVQWWDQCRPTGAMPGLSLQVQWGQQTNLQATFDLRPVELTLPMDPHQRRLSLTQGQIVLSWPKEQVKAQALHGRIEDLDFQLTGQCLGFSDQAAFDLDLQLAGPVPNDPRQRAALPASILRYLNRFNPDGPFALKLKLARLWADGKEQWKYQGQADFFRVKAKDSHNPYPIENMVGHITFNQDRLDLDLRGQGPTGGNVHVHGWAAPPTDAAQVLVQADITDLPIDSVLMQSLEPPQRKAVQSFLDQQAQQELIDAGLIQKTPSTPGLDGVKHGGNPSIPTFDLGGKVNLVMTFNRPLGDEVEWKIITLIDLTGLNVIPTYWPYPLTIEQGKVEIQGERVKVHTIHARGLTGAVGTLTGVFHPPAKNQTEGIPELDITLQKIPADPLLLRSIPPRHQPLVRDLKIQGQFNGSAQVRGDAQGRTNFDIDVHLDQGKAQPFAGGYTLDNLTAHLQIQRDGLTIRKAQGQHGQGQIELSGQAQWTDQGLDLSLQFQGKKLLFEDAVLDLAPADLPALQAIRNDLKSWALQGQYDAQLAYRTGPGRTDDFTLTLEPAKLGFNRQDRRIELADMQGSVQIKPGQLTFQDFAATFGKARLAVRGWVGLQSPWTADLAMDLTTEMSEESLVRELPPAVALAIQSLSFQGAVTMRDAKFSLLNQAQGQVMDFRAALDLSQAQCMVGVPITELQGSLNIHAHDGPDTGGMRLDLNLQAQKLRAMERLIQPLNLHIVSATSSQILDIATLQGECYGGTILGAGAIAPAQGMYRLHLSLSDAALDPLAHPERDLAWQKPTAPAPGSSPGITPGNSSVPSPAGGGGRVGAIPSGSGGDPRRPTGVLSAALSVEGKVQDPQSKRGRGQMQIRDAKLYELPLALTMLQIINLRWPSDRAFDRASAQFLLDGDHVLIDPLRFEAPNVVIAGSGTLLFPTHGLDLRLFSRSPGKIDTVEQALNLLKDELVTIRVTGTLENPQARVESFTGIRQTWEDIFGKPLQSSDAPAGWPRLLPWSPRFKSTPAQSQPNTTNP